MELDSRYLSVSCPVRSWLLTWQCSGSPDGVESPPSSGGVRFLGASQPVASLWPWGILAHVSAILWVSPSCLMPQCGSGIPAAQLLLVKALTWCEQPCICTDSWSPAVTCGLLCACPSPLPSPQARTARVYDTSSHKAGSQRGKGVRFLVFPGPVFISGEQRVAVGGGPGHQVPPQICSQALAAIPWVLGTAAVERAGHGGLTCFALLFAPQAALKKYQAEQRGKGDTLDKCQAELKKLRKKSQGSKNPQKYSDKELQVGCCGPGAPAPPRGWGGRVLCVPHPHGGSRAAPPGEIGQPSSRPGGFHGRPLACAGSLSRAPEGSLPKEQSPRGNLFLSRPSGFPPQTDPRLFL